MNKVWNTLQTRFVCVVLDLRILIVKSFEDSALTKPTIVLKIASIFSIF